MNPMAKRLERLERLLEARHAGGCLSCALARMSDPGAACDGEGCRMTLAQLLMEEPCATC